MANLQLLIDISIFETRRPAVEQRLLHAGADHEFHARGVRDRREERTGDSRRHGEERGAAPAARGDAGGPIDERAAEGVAEPAANARDILAVLLRREPAGRGAERPIAGEDAVVAPAQIEKIQLGLETIDPGPLLPVIADPRAEGDAGAIAAGRDERMGRRRKTRDGFDAAAARDRKAHARIDAEVKPGPGEDRRRRRLRAGARARGEERSQGWRRSRASWRRRGKSYFRGIRVAPRPSRTGTRALQSSRMTAS